MYQDEKCLPRKELLGEIFGVHNLTSDTEPPEVLLVSRGVIRSIFGENRKSILNPNTDPSYIPALQGQNRLLYTLYGEKVL